MRENLTTPAMMARLSPSLFLWMQRRLLSAENKINLCVREPAAHH
jgi:hypothetical protein